MNNKPENKKDQTKKAAPVMKRLAREVSPDELKAVTGGGCLGCIPASHDIDYPTWAN